MNKMIRKKTLRMKLGKSRRLSNQGETEFGAEETKTQGRRESES